MSVGVGMIGREIALQFGGSVLQGVSTKGGTFANEALETTDDNSNGWQEFLAKPGKKSVEYPFSGLLKNLELVNAWFGASQIFAVTVTYPDGSVLSFDGFLESFSETGESGALVTYEASVKSTGVVTFTPGV